MNTRYFIRYTEDGVIVPMSLRALPQKPTMPAGIWHEIHKPCCDPDYIQYLAQGDKKAWVKIDGKGTPRNGPYVRRMNLAGGYFMAVPFNICCDVLTPGLFTFFGLSDGGVPITGLLESINIENSLGVDVSAGANIPLNEDMPFDLGSMPDWTPPVEGDTYTANFTVDTDLDYVATLTIEGVPTTVDSGLASAGVPVTFDFEVPAGQGVYPTTPVYFNITFSDPA